MKLAIVFPSPLTRGDPLTQGIGGAYATRTLQACAMAANVRDLETKSFFAVTSPLPGGKAPSIADLRKERTRIREELHFWEPDAVLTVGAPALNVMDDGPKSLAISKERGRMRLATDGLGQPRWPWVPTISNVAVALHSDLHRDFSADVFKVLSQSAPIPAMRIDTLVPQNLGQLEDALHLLDEASVVGVDVETTGLSPYRDGLLAVGFGAIYDEGPEGLAVVVTKEMLAHPQVDEILWDAVWRKSRRSVGHNFKFDMQFMLGWVGWAPDEASIGDTLLMAHLLDERPNRPTSRVRGLGLKDLVAINYDHQYGFDFKDFYEATMNAEEGKSEDEFHERVAVLYDDMHAYLAQDVCYTARLWHDLTVAEAEGPAMLKVHDELLMPVSRTIAKLEMRGSPIDVPWVEETVAAFDRRIARRKEALERQLAVLTPRVNVDVSKPAQIADVMYDDWKMTPDIRKHGIRLTGDRSTDKDHIKSAVAKYLGTELDGAARWLRSLEKWRREVRQRTTYQKSLLNRVDADGRVRPSFLIHGTSTGRLSAQGPAIQTIPAINREDSLQFRPMRRAFRPQDGRQWVEVDYSQLELRVAAAISGDEDFANVFRSGRDVHREIASGVFSKAPEDISDGERFLAKAVAFGIIYGRGGEALATGAEMRYAEQKLGMTPWTADQADAFIKKFRRDYPKLDEWMKQMYAETPRKGYVESPFGRRRRFPLYPQHKGELGSIQRQAVNTPVQSAASDICLEAMIEIERRLDRSRIDAKVLFPVHDSICLEVAPHHVYKLEALCRSVMEKNFMGVPLEVDFEVGPTWADVEKVRA